MSETLPRQIGSDRLADTISAEIQSGALAPGLWLKQVDIEQRYGVTRNTARLALHKLTVQRFVQHEPNRGYRVPFIDARKRTELLRVRVTLEASLVPEIVVNVTEAAIRELGALADAFNAELPAAEFLRLVEINTAFHARMQQLAGNGEAVRIIQSLRHELRPFPGMMWDSPARMARSGQEHVAMVEALGRRDAERLMRLVASHIGKDDVAVAAIVSLQPIPPSA